MSSLLGGSIAFTLAGVLLLTGSALVATDTEVRIGATLIVWGVAAVSYAFGAATYREGTSRESGEDGSATAWTKPRSLGKVVV